MESIYRYYFAMCVDVPNYVYFQDSRRYARLSKRWRLSDIHTKQQLKLILQQWWRWWRLLKLNGVRVLFSVFKVLWPHYFRWSDRAIEMYSDPKINVLWPQCFIWGCGGLGWGVGLVRWQSFVCHVGRRLLGRLCVRRLSAWFPWNPACPVSA